MGVPDKRPAGNSMFKQYCWGKLNEDVYKSRSRVKGNQQTNAGRLRTKGALRLQSASIVVLPESGEVSSIKIVTLSG